jgi:hypothetical protein
VAARVDTVNPAEGRVIGSIVRIVKKNRAS